MYCFDDCSARLQITVLPYAILHMLDLQHALVYSNACMRIHWASCMHLFATFAIQNAIMLARL